MEGEGHKPFCRSGALKIPLCYVFAPRPGHFPKRLPLQSDQKSHFLSDRDLTEKWEKLNRLGEGAGLKRLLVSVLSSAICSTPLTSQQLQSCPHVTRDDVTHELLLFAEHFEVFA